MIKPTPVGRGYTQSGRGYLQWAWLSAVGVVICSGRGYLQKVNKNLALVTEFLNFGNISRGEFRNDLFTDLRDVVGDQDGSVKSVVLNLKIKM